MPSIAERMAQAKAGEFVGREAERSVFRAAVLGEDTPPFCLLYLYGPGGVGKSTLLRTFAGDCSVKGIPFSVLDGRNIEPTPVGFTDALRSALQLSPGDDPLTVLAHTDTPYILFVDTYEQLAGLDGWLREVFLPHLSGEVFVVIAGRHPLPVAWLAEGWQSMVHVIALRNLTGPESRAYLTRRAVPDTLHRVALDFTHGHPLALSLIADVFTRPGATSAGLGFTPESVPDVVQALLERFVEGVPGPSHRAALETAALLRVTDEGVLGEMLRPADSQNGDSLPPEETRALFEWLRGLSFMEPSPSGLFPHDVVREALLADLRWRNRDRYVALHQRARNYFASRLREASARDQQRLLYDCLFLHRDNGVIRAAFTWQESASLYPDAFRASDLTAVCDMVRTHEGDESARIAAHWLTRQPDQAVVFRDLSEADGRPVGFFLMLLLHRTTDDERESDPGAKAAWQYLTTNAPLRSGEVATHLRFWMARDSHQNPSPVQSLLIIHALRHFLTHSHLALTFFACADPDLWEPVFEYVHIPRLPEAGYTVGEKSYGVYGHDWRSQPASEWLERLFEMEVTATTGDTAGTTAAADARPAQTSAPLLVLSEPDFAAAVRDALKGFHRPNALTGSPLLRSRMVVSVSGTGADTETRAEALRGRIAEGATRLLASPKMARGYRALHRTYLEPARTQEEAADLLDLPFNTYRRHLGEGIDALTNILWREEIGESVGI